MNVGKLLFFFISPPAKSPVLQPDVELRQEGGESAHPLLPVQLILQVGGQAVQEGSEGAANFVKLVKKIGEV